MVITMKSSNKRIFTIIVAGILAGIGVGIYVYNELSHIEHIVPIYLSVDKKEVNMGENVTIYIKIGITKYPFELSNQNTYSGGIGIYRIPDGISPDQVLRNKTLQEKIVLGTVSQQSGHVPFVINNKKEIFKFIWNCTFPGYNTYYNAPKGYYFVYIESYAIAYGHIEPRFIINENSIFYLKGIYAKMEDSHLIINSTEPLDFHGKIKLTYSNFTVHYTKYMEFNYSGRSFSIDLEKENIEVPCVYVILITPYGKYWVGEYVHSKGE